MIVQCNGERVKRGIISPIIPSSVSSYISYYQTHIKIRLATRLRTTSLETLLLIASVTYRGNKLTASGICTLVYGRNYTINHLRGINNRIDTLLKHGYIMNISSDRVRRFVLTSYAIEVLNSVE